MNKQTSFKELEYQIIELGNPSEITYFNFHQKRFERVYDFVAPKFTSQPVKILDIGSHFLHTSCLMKSLGHEVEGMDVSEFWEMKFVQDRAENWGVKSRIENNLSALPSLQNEKDKYDLVLFTEILEHITFNPVTFWKKIYDSIRDGGYIYISTPNSFALPNFVRNLKNMLMLKSIGITVPDILDKVTYGHHWKEYSASEIKAYFNLLSEDFEVSIDHYHYKNHELKGSYFFFNLLARFGNLTKVFSDELEVIIQVKKTKGWKREPPHYS